MRTTEQAELAQQVPATDPGDEPEPGNQDYHDGRGARKTSPE